MNTILAALFLAFGVWILTAGWVIEDPALTRIPLDADNRMLRFGFGKHDGKWFVRVDLWFVGFRLS